MKLFRKSALQHYMRPTPARVLFFVYPDRSRRVQWILRMRKSMISCSLFSDLLNEVKHMKKNPMLQTIKWILDFEIPWRYLACNFQPTGVYRG
jgi:hypothetical protein